MMSARQHGHDDRAEHHGGDHQRDLEVAPLGVLSAALLRDLGGVGARGHAHIVSHTGGSAT